MNREQGIAELSRTRIIAIVRGVESKDIIQVGEALLAGGITVMEVTLNTPGALGMISTLQERLGNQMYIGAGTILDKQDARQAEQAGASFFVTPNTDKDVIHYAARRNIPVYPGAMTPTEIVRAWKAGATAIKIFPSNGLGLPFLKELMGPLNHISMVAVGGVTEDNIAEYFKIGCVAVGIGGSLVNLKEIASGNYSWITDKASRLVERANA